jgi:hypothetical protein
MLIGSPALGGQMPAAAAPKSLRAAVMSKVEALGTENAVALSQDVGAGASSSESGKSFFKSKKGAAALILVAGALTWMLVSRQQDMIHSPAR